MKNTPVSKKQMEAIHPYIPELYDKLKAGTVSRRDFLRISTLLGMSASLAVACGSAADEPTAVPAANENTSTGGETEVEATVAPPPSGASKRGGTLT
jgi:hypothetical protein